MAATFIFSLDCEGKWGVADLLGPSWHAALTDERLTTSYRQLLALLDRYDIPATFAFVGLFAEPAGSFAHLDGPLRAMAASSPSYLAPALADLESGSRQGWHGDWAVDLVGSARTAHEIGFHGVTHIPWDAMDESMLAGETELFRGLSGPVRDSRTMVFPRNRVAHLRAVRELGITGYRDGLHRARLANLLDEFNPVPALQHGGAIDDGVIRIPAGYFVNWQSGPRRLVPRRWGRLRAKALLERAARAGAIVHFWLHPENLASAPRTLERVEDLLALVAEARDSGRCEVQTQLGYCLSAREPRPQAPATAEAVRRGTAT